MPNSYSIAPGMTRVRRLPALELRHSRESGNPLQQALHAFDYEPSALSENDKLTN